jgi:dTDP-4-dehydrorhamnose 3,5-epimerase
MKIKTKFKDLIIIKNKTFKDNRGYFKELFKEKDINKKFPFIVMSYSGKNVIRGLHIQTYNSQGKYVSVLKGKIFDVAVDLRKNSKTFGKIFKTILSEKNSKSIYIPPGFAHGFCTLEKENHIIYSCTKYRDAKSEKGILFNDKYLNIKWPIKNPILSKKDRLNMSFKEFIKLSK